MNKIFEKLQFILDKINALLAMLGNIAMNGISKITPDNIKKVKDKIHSVATKEKDKDAPPFFQTLLQKIKDNTPAAKEKLLKTLSSIATFLKKLTFSNAFKIITPAVKSVILPPLYKLRDKYNALSPKTIIISTTIGLFIGLAALNFYMATKRIIDETAEKEIIPIEKVEPRPKYYKAQLKQIRITDIKMPIYVESAKDIKSLVMDFTLESSNRYIKKFFEKNSHYLQDKLNTTVEPIVPSLPLEEEGKNIIKEKLIDESNDLIKSYEIKGEIKEVYFHSIIAS